MIAGAAVVHTARKGCKAPARKVTGRMVLLCLLGFFAIVFAVNGVMIHEALSTFGGVETESAYQAGRKYEEDVAMAQGAGRAAMARRRQR